MSEKMHLQACRKLLNFCKLFRFCAFRHAIFGWSNVQVAQRDKPAEPSRPVNSILCDGGRGSTARATGGRCLALETASFRVAYLILILITPPPGERGLWAAVCGG